MGGTFRQKMSFPKKASYNWPWFKILLSTNVLIYALLICNRPCVSSWSTFCYTCCVLTNYAKFEKCDDILKVLHPIHIKPYIIWKEISQGIQKCNQNWHRGKHLEDIYQNMSRKLKFYSNFSFSSVRLITSPT